MQNIRTLIIHAGGSKTGSSAIQAFCELHAENLGSQGYTYNNSKTIIQGYEFCCGNGITLYEALSNPTFSEITLDEVLNWYFGDSDTALCSSEYFAELPSTGWQRLVESSLRLHLKLKVIFYVRSVIPYFLSNYDQVIKSAGEFRTLMEWSSDTTSTWQHFDTLLRLSEFIDQLELLVIPYDKNKHSLLESFFEAIGSNVSLVSTDKDDQDKTVNRSLTNLERSIMIAANKSLGAAFSQEIAELLIYSFPELSSEKIEYDNEWVDLIVSKYRDASIWINETFGGKNSLVEVPTKITSTTSKTNKVPSQSSQSEIEAMRLVFDWALKKLSAIQEDTRHQIIKPLLKAANSSIKPNPSGLPHDFDPVAYLLLNLDILFAQKDPYTHYAEFGKAERRACNFERHVGAQSHQEISNHDQKIRDLSTSLMVSMSRQKELIRQNIDLAQAVSTWKKQALEATQNSLEREREFYTRLRQHTDAHNVEAIGTDTSYSRTGK